MRLPDFSTNRTLAYGFAIFAFALALSARFALESTFPPGFPYLTFFPAVIVTAFLAGTAPAALTAGLSTLAAWYWFVEPSGAFGTDSGSLIPVLFFVAIIALDIVLIHVMREALKTAEQERTRADALLVQFQAEAERNRLLFQDMQHRIANSLALVSSLVALHQRRLDDVPAAADALADIHTRLETMSRIHRHLHDPGADGAGLRAMLARLTNDLISSAPGTGALSIVEVDDVPLEPQQIVTLALFVTEAVTNCLKHAFGVSNAPEVRVRMRREGDQVSLSIQDNGRGFPDGFEDTKDRLGLRILRNFAALLGGEVRFASENGAVVSVSFPLAAAPATSGS